MSEASVLINRNQPHCETARGVVPDPDRLAEPIWSYRYTDTAESLSSSSPSVHPGVKRVAYRVQGLSIGTQEPAPGCRRLVRRLPLRSRVMVVCGGGVPVVVGGRESRSQGEGEQVLGRVR